MQRLVAIDGKVFPVRTVAGFSGRVSRCDERVVELRQPMGHTILFSLPELAKSLGGERNALALFQDARAHRDAVMVRFESAGYAYHNTEQFQRFERARGIGNAVTYDIMESQRRAAERSQRLELLNQLRREERSR